MTNENHFKKTLCYISNLGNNTISILDIDKRLLTETIQLPFSPFKISNINNKIYASSNGSDMAIISTDDNHIDTMNIPNNGNILINKKYNHIYVSNTSYISVYSTKDHKLITTIKPFGIVDNFGLTYDNEWFFVIDLLKKDLKIYDVSNFKLLYQVKDIGIKPCCALVNNNNKVAYVASKSIKNTTSYNIYVVNLEGNYISNIPLSDNSLITSLVLKDNILYACNKGLNRVEVIDTITNSLIKSISTTLPEPQNLLLVSHKDILLVTNRNSGGLGGLDIINIPNNVITQSINMPVANNEPYDIAMIIKDDVPPIEIKKDITENKDLVPVTIKRLLTTYNEDALLSNIIISLPTSYAYPVHFQNILFKKSLIMHEVISSIPNEVGYYNINFTLKTPYIVKFRDRNSKIITIKKFLMDNKELKLEIPNVNKKHKIKLSIDTKAKIYNEPVLIKDIFKFSTQLCITLNIFSEFDTMVPINLLEE